MEAVDEEGEQNSEEELLSKNGEATSANEDDSIASKFLHRSSQRQQMMVFLQ